MKDCPKEVGSKYTDKKILLDSLGLSADLPITMLL